MLRLILTAALSLAWLQQPAPVPAVDGFTRQSGQEPTQHIDYALLSVFGRVVPAPAAADPAVIPPRLTAQCTRDAQGKLRFELLADFGNVQEIRYVPPWRAGPGELYPPRLTPVSMTMEFLGYTHVKPVKRQWSLLQAPAGELAYSTPGLSSGNMETVQFYLQYLRALPTLRLTAAGRGTVEFETAAWQAALKAEPLCHASGL